jgi:hypothetical protein
MMKLSTVESAEITVCDHYPQPASSFPLKVKKQSSSKDVPLYSGSHPIIARIVNRSATRLRRPVAMIFNGLEQLLGQLRTIEEVLLAQNERPQAAIPLFEDFYATSRSVLADVEATAARTEKYKRTLAEALDGTSFAIEHEIRRVFELELLVVDAGQPPQQFRAEMMRAYGLLANCIQQSICTIAQVFNPELTINDLFSDTKQRQEESVALYEQLWLLLRLICRAETEKNLSTYLALKKGMNVFRKEYLHFLMYKDWAELENFADKIGAAQNPDEIQAQLHLLGSYVETLIGHVRMRAVLAEHIAKHDPQHAEQLAVERTFDQWANTCNLF